MMLIIFGVIFLLISGWFIAGCPGTKSCPFFKEPKVDPKKVTLNFVGTWEYGNDWKETIDAFNKFKKLRENGFVDVAINIERVEDVANYEDILKERRFQGKQPNIFMIFHSWVPRYEAYISKVPENVMTVAKFKNTYARAAVDDLVTKEGVIYALPFYIDTLALYYNENMFLNERIVEPPKNWTEFENYVEKLTFLKKDQETKEILTDLDGNPMIDIAGAAFGGGSNVNRSQDILMLLVMQNNYDEENPVSFKTEGAKRAIRFYTDFTDPVSRFYTWNKNEIFSIDAFTQRRSAMMINYSSQIRNVDEKTGNALNYKVALIPQLDDKKTVNYASYWVPVVAKKAPCNAQAGLKVDCEKLAWEFLSFASKKSNTKMYLNSSNRAAANLEIAKEQSLAEDNRSVFAKQVFTAQTWFNKNDIVADQKLLEMTDFLIANEKNRKQLKKAMDTTMDYIGEINK